MKNHRIDPNSPRPLYQQVKDYIIRRIDDGELRTNMRIESEHELVQSLGVSRMTVNRALRELTATGTLFRLQGVGTFVADRKPQSALFEIKSIAQEITNRGGIHTSAVHLLQEEKAKPALAKAMHLEAYAPVFHTIILHSENNIPIQLADRYVNPAIAGDFLAQDFTRITPNEYLLSLYPITEVEHVIEAVIPDDWIRCLLDINAAEPCLLLHRKTWVEDTIATRSAFYYPGSRHSIGGRFKPSAAGTLHIT